MVLLDEMMYAKLLMSFLTPPNCEVDSIEHIGRPKLMWKNMHLNVQLALFYSKCRRLLKVDVDDSELMVSS